MSQSPYRSLLGLLASLAMVLLAIVDFRRGFLFEKTVYVYKTPYFIFSPWQLALLVAGTAGGVLFARHLRHVDAKMTKVSLAGIFVLLLLDVALYRGVAASRAIDAGKVGLDWLNAYEVGGVLKPLALTVSYVLTVWHATLLSCLGAGLAVLALPRLFGRLAGQSGWRGSFSGAAYSLTQPFCSCCAAMTAPGLFRTGHSMNFATAVLLGAPLLNISTLILAGTLLPWPFAFIRIVGGVAITLVLSALLSQWLGSLPIDDRDERLLARTDAQSPSDVFTSWLKISGRIALVLVPSMIVGTILAGIVWSLWPAQMENSPLAVLFTSLVGSLVMVSTWSEIPLAAQMIQHGMTGPAAAALVALPAVNLGNLLIIGKVSRNWKLAAAMGAGIVVLSSAVGLAFL